MNRKDRSKNKTEEFSFNGITSLFCTICDVFGKDRKDRISDSLTADTGITEKMINNSFFFGLSGRKRIAVLLLKIKNVFASLCERSLLFSVFEKLIDSCITVSAKTYAALFSSFSATSAIILVLKYLIGNGDIDKNKMMFVIALFVSSVPFFFTERNLYDLLSSGFFFGKLLFGSKDIRIKELTEKKQKNLSGGVSFLFGIIFGMLSWFIGVYYFPLVLGFAFVFSLFLRFPETGIVLAAFICPWLGLSSKPSVTLASFTGITAIAYFLKYIRGKRSFIKTAELVPFLFLFVSVFASGFSDFAYSFRTALLVCVLMLSYLLCLNLLRNQSRIKSIVIAVCASSAAVSAIGIIQYISGLSPTGWVDLSLFASIPGRTVSVFENPNMLGAYLITVFPFSLYLLTDKNGKYRFFGAFCIIFNLVCALFTWSRLCWLGMFVGTLVFLWFMTPRAVLLVPATAVVSTGLGFVFPDTIGKRLLNFISLRDSTNSYRLRVWKGSFITFFKNFFIGYGIGDPAFRASYLNYAMPGTEAAVHSHSIYLQLGIAGGIIPVLSLLVFFFFLMKKCFYCKAHQRNGTTANIAFSAFASVASMMFCGIFDYVFYNYRVMFMFFIAAGIFSAAAMNAVAVNDEPYSSFSPDSADIRLDIKW